MAIKLSDIFLFSPGASFNLSLKPFYFLAISLTSSFNSSFFSSISILISSSVLESVSAESPTTWDSVREEGPATWVTARVEGPATWETARVEVPATCETSRVEGPATWVTSLSGTEVEVGYSFIFFFDLSPGDVPYSLLCMETSFS